MQAGEQGSHTRGSEHCAAVSDVSLEHGAHPGPVRRDQPLVRGGELGGDQLLAVTLTKDPRLIAVIAVATGLPWLLVSLPAGVLVDRHDRATLMWRAQLVQGAVVTVIVAGIAGHLVDIWALAAAGFLLGSAQVVFDNAAQSVLPSLVPPDLLPKANGTQYVVQVVGGAFLGPPVGSALFALAPFAPFGVDAVSFAGSAALPSGLPRQRPDHRPGGRPATGRGRAGISAGLPPSASGKASYRASSSAVSTASTGCWAGERSRSAG
jgi:hypothetical protein